MYEWFWSWFYWVKVERIYHKGGYEIRVGKWCRYWEEKDAADGLKSVDTELRASRWEEYRERYFYG